MGPIRRTAAAQTDDAGDEDVLAGQGYKQELDRSWGLLQNFGVSFSIISVVTGTVTLFQFGLTTGGPGTMVAAWLIVGAFTFFVGLGMAEVTSAHPTAGGPFYWAAMLAPPDRPDLVAACSWFTGWFNFLGQVAVTTGITFGCAGLISTLATVKGSYEATPAKVIGIYAALLISHGIVNTFGAGMLKYLNHTSIALHSLGVTAFAIAVVATAPTHRSAREVFGLFHDGTGVNGAEGWSVRASPAYVAILGSLMAQYTITGFDASAHLSEETRSAQKTAPLGVLMSIGCSLIFGFFLILCLLFSIQDFDRTVDSEAGQPVLQILLDIFSEDGAIALFTLVIVCIWHCGLFSLTSNSRMYFAFARDGGIPRWFAHIHARFRSPVRTIWLGAFLSFCLALPSLGSTVAFSAATSIATIGLYLSYGAPILIGLIWPQHFKKGPFNLGVASKPVALVAVSWIFFITIVFCLPQLNPVDRETLNYTPVAVGIVTMGSSISWIWARKYFTGPVRHIGPDGAIAVEDADPVETSFERNDKSV